MADKDPIALHHITLHKREDLHISGVDDVESFDEHEIALATKAGFLLVRGEDLHIEKLSLDGGELSVKGKIDSLSYEDVIRQEGGFLRRLFRP